jgi:hypothetical protein
MSAAFLGPLFCVWGHSGAFGQLLDQNDTRFPMSRDLWGVRICTEGYCVSARSRPFFLILILLLFLICLGRIKRTGASASKHAEQEVGT